MGRGESMGKKLTRIDWSDIKTALQLVPSRARTEAWVKLNSLTETILSKKADIAKEYSPETLRFSIDCKLCSKTISVLDSYVAHANGDTLHYDCNMVYKETA
jgi:hypothetical protein